MASTSKTKDTNYVERGSRDDKASIDKKDPLVKNSWKWEWLDFVHKETGQKLSDCIRVIKKPGFCVCILCDKEIKYAARGRVALVDHVGHRSHTDILKLRKSNTLFPGKFSGINLDFNLKSSKTKLRIISMYTCVCVGL